ncbi:carbon monoxide dehydrogenase subunit G [Acrocarpospora corrugata]|uniref:Carbon monoxide dehydrogenase subunit G n=1 Tax=Acrocarpospora corrugata TaxID=35763 RepID=A0A5M3VXI9_9ACTN|nr:SRPBCC family protein [Acrocarpospora corrugata]GES00422.1 carbon monoxide dehydrogenase subunit G [Acrocarpospora corrugata]
MAMRFEHEFTVPVPVEQAWAVLLDAERVAPCLPGASLDSVEGDTVTGKMRVKVGPITVTYHGAATFEDVDKDAHTLTLRASGKEARGAGTASATVAARLIAEGDTTRVTVETSFNVTGRPAQFGRGVMNEVGSRLIDRFAVNLAGILQEGSPEPVPVPQPAPEIPRQASAPDQDEHPRHLTAVPTPRQTPLTEEGQAREAHPAGTSRTSRTPDEEALDLLEIAGAPVLKRLAPALAALGLLALVFWLIRRARHR